MFMHHLSLLLLMSLGSTAFAVPPDFQRLPKDLKSEYRHAEPQDVQHETTSLRVEAEEVPRRETQQKVSNGNFTILHTYQIPLLESDLADSIGTSWGGLADSGDIDQPLPIYSGQGVLFSLNERFVMFRPKPDSSQSSQTLIYDLKERKRLSYSPRSGLFSESSDYFAETHKGKIVRVVDVRTEQVIGKAIGNPLWPHTKTFTNHFIITETDPPNAPINSPKLYTLNSFKGGSLDLGITFAISGNGRILYLQDGKIKCVDGRTLKEVALPAKLRKLSGTAGIGYSDRLNFETEKGHFIVFPGDLSFYDKSKSDGYWYSNRFYRVTTTGKTIVYDLKRNRKVEVDGYANGIDFNPAIGTLLFTSEDKQKTTVLNTKTFKVETVPGRWDRTTQDGNYLLPEFNSEKNAKVYSMQRHAEETFQIPGEVKYLPRQQGWVITVKQPNEERYHFVIENPHSILDGYNLFDSFSYEISRTGRYLVGAVSGQVRLLEIADPVVP